MSADSEQNRMNKGWYSQPDEKSIVKEVSGQTRSKTHILMSRKGVREVSGLQVGQTRGSTHILTSQDKTKERSADSKWDE